MKKVLVVEDEYSIRDVIAINLDRAGYEAVRVPSAERALEVYNEAPDSFDIALLDIMLPGMDGLELCRLIREKNKNIGIIMLTAKVQEADKIRGLSIGADDYVTNCKSRGSRQTLLRQQRHGLCPHAGSIHSGQEGQACHQERKASGSHPGRVPDN